MSEPLPHEDFVTRLQMLFRYLKIKNKNQMLETVQILLKDNINLKAQIEERSNEQGNSEEGIIGDSEQCGHDGVGARTSNHVSGHGDRQDSTATTDVRESNK